MNSYQRTLLLTTLGSALLGSTAAVAESYPEWAQDERSGIVRSGSGECWRTGTWSESSRNPTGCVPLQDSDGDGVTDDLDRCPATAAGIKVDSHGCELDSDGDGVVNSADNCPQTVAGAAVDARGCELDSDGDGVVDSADRCPGTSAGVAVDRSGCEADSDGDGVVDRLDQCPATPRGTPVQANGCERFGKLTLDGTLFGSDSAELTPAAQQTLNALAERLRRAGGTLSRIVITGHTDNSGRAAHNRTLSLRRAAAVRHYLTSVGEVQAAQIEVRGVGSNEPVASNATAAGRAKNRRVDISIEQ